MPGAALALDSRPVEDQRRAPAPELAHLGVAEIVAHYEGVVRGLSEPPLLVGHSFGGLFVQMLLDRGLGRAGVAIDSAPPAGIPANQQPGWEEVAQYAAEWLERS